MNAGRSGVRVGLAAALVALLFAGCWVDTGTNTGVRINVTYHESVNLETPENHVDTLRFYVAVQHPDGLMYLLNESASGIVVDVSERDLSADPYQLFVGRGRPWMERIRVVVVGERNGEHRFYGQLTDPEYQDFQSGQIVQRTIRLLPPHLSFDMSWTQTDCLVGVSRHADFEGFTFGSESDKDCDGHEVPDDCDDLNPDVYPSPEPEHDCDGVDNNCDGRVDEGGNEDNDGDTYTPCNGDCDDNNAYVNPGAVEVCDGLDNDCSGKCDGEFDLDGDGYTDCGMEATSYFLDHATGECTRPVPRDCDDNDPEVHPEAPERCNFVDDNCNDLCDEGLDVDGDGFNECGSKDPYLDPTSPFCADPGTPGLVDCEEGNPAVHPDAEEVCDGADNNCDGSYATVSSPCYEFNASNTLCNFGNMDCSESSTGGTWGSCAIIEPGVSEPFAFCGLFPYCREAPAPGYCIDMAVDQSLALGCHVYFTDSFGRGMTPDVCGPNTTRGIYPLPFGFSGNSNCTWHLLLGPGANAYQHVGLINPADPTSTVANVLYNCEAALVVQPGPTITTQPTQVQGVLSFYYDNGPADFYGMSLPLTINAVPACDGGGNEGLDCEILTP